MNNQPLYVPILKWKDAEIGALRDLSPAEKENITPLIQLVPKYRKVNDNPLEYAAVPEKEVLNKSLGEIQKYLGDMKLYLDPNLLCGNEDDVLEAVSSSSTLFGNKIVPVLRLADLKNSPHGDKVLAFISKQGICLRVREEELNDDFWAKIDDLLSKVGLQREKVDLLVDYQVTAPNQSDSFLAELKKDHKSNEWRSFYFASGAFPEDLSKFTVGTNEWERKDWNQWAEIIEKKGNLRKPGFSDYVMQYPIYSQPVNNPNTSYSIRYATPKKWIVMRGQARKAKGSTGSLQYFAHAQMLVQHESFCGEQCCKGDGYITEKSKQPFTKPGNSTTWLRASINHHMALTLKQLVS